VGLVCLNDPESYIDSSITTDRASNARKVKGNDPDILQFGEWHGADTTK